MVTRNATIALCVLAVVQGCGLLVQPSSPDGIATYNNQVFQLLTSILTTVATIVGFIGLYIRSNLDKKELKKETVVAAAMVAAKTEAAAKETAAQTTEALTQVKEGLDVIATQTSRTRSTDQK